MRALTGKEIGRLMDVIDDLFDPDEFKVMLRRRLNKKFHNLHKGGSYTNQVFEAVTAADRGGWAPRLLEAMLADRPDSEALRQLAADVGHLAPDVYKQDLTNRQPEGFLEKYVRAGSLISWPEFTGNLLQAQRAVCSIKLSGDQISYGTGFLVGPDLLLTNYHVVEKLQKESGSIQDLQLRFDYANEPAERNYLLPAEKVDIVAHSPNAELSVEAQDLVLDWPAGHLDYALIRLPDPLGAEAFGPLSPNGGTPRDTTPRGWLKSTAMALFPEDDVIIAQHPNGRPLRIGLGVVLGVSNNGRRLRYNTNTDNGSSGAPCFNARMEWVGLHHYGTETGGFNQGIPLAAILEDLTGRGIDLNQNTD